MKLWNHGKDMVKHIAKFWTRCLFTCKHPQRCRESCYIPATEQHRRRNRPPANTKPAAFSGSRLAHEDMNGSTRYSNMAGQYKWRLERLGKSSNLVDLTCRDPAKIEGNWRCNQSTLCGAPSCSWFITSSNPISIIKAWFHQLNRLRGSPSLSNRFAAKGP